MVIAAHNPGMQRPEMYEPDPDALAIERATIEHIELLQGEAQEYRSRAGNGMSLEQEMEQAGNRYIGNHWVNLTASVGREEGFRVYQVAAEDGLMGLRRSTLNRTGTAILSNVAGQTQSELVVRFDPMETGTARRGYLSREAGQTLHEMFYGPLEAIQQQRDESVRQAAGDLEAIQGVNEAAEQQTQAHLAQFPVRFAVDQLLGEHGPSQPIDRRQIAFVRRLIESGMLEHDDLIVVDDTLKAKVAQKLWDSRWNRAGGDYHLLLNELQCNIFGFQATLFQWHTSGPNRHGFTLENIHPLNVWIDHNHDDIAKSDYVLLDYLMTEEQARAVLPHTISDEEITRAASDGPVTSPQIRHAKAWSGHNFRRRMVLVRIGWLRHHQVPMTIAEALDEGLVAQQPLTEPFLDEQGQPVIDPETGQPVIPVLDQHGEPVMGYVRTDTGEPVEPQEQVGHGTAWPDTSGLRQVMVVPAANRVVQDIRCPYLDIPVLWNINIPRGDGSPFGIGEPLRLEDISQQINRTLSVMDNYLRYYQFPQLFVPEPLYHRFKQSGLRPFSRPGAWIPIPMDLWKQVVASGGFNAMVQQIPVMPELFAKLLDRLLDEHDKLSGNVDVRQGRAPFSGASGALVERLTAQASGPLAMRSRFTEYALERAARLAIDAMVKWMPEVQVQKTIGWLELPVLRDVMSELAATEFNVTVEIASGRGVNRQVDEQRALAMYGQGLLSKRTTQERLGVPDPDAEQRRMQTEMMQASLGAAPVQAAMVDQQDAAVQRQQQSGSAKRQQETPA